MENQGHNSDFSNSDMSDESNKKLKMKPLSQDEEGYEREGLHEVSSGSSKKIVKVGEKKNGRKFHESNTEMHLRIERERRRKMRNMFSTLHHMIPELPSKVDQITIVTETMNYIKSLEQTVEMLEKQKQERLQNIYPFGYESSMINSSDETSLISSHGSCNNLLCEMSSNSSNSITSTTLIPEYPPVAFQTWCSPNVVLNICGNKAQFCIYTTKNNLDLLTSIAFVLDKHNIEVIVANIWCNDVGKGCMILAQANNVVSDSDQIPEATLLEQIYKQATEEIKLLIS